MNTCEGWDELLALWVGGDLSEDEARRADAHVMGCVRCASEVDKLKSVIALARTSGTPDLRLPEGVRRAIVLEATENILRRRSRWIGFFSPSASWRSVALGSLAASMLALLLLLPGRKEGVGPKGDPDISKVSVSVQQDGAVHLVWSNGGRATYTVYRGEDPSALERGEVHVVRGHSWTDRESQEGPIVYYRIE